MAQNRTSEFFSLAQSLPAASPTPAAPTTNKSTTTLQLRDFHQTAGGISRDIASTSALLAELAQRVKASRQQQSYADNNDTTTTTLVIQIKQSIENLHTRLDSASSQLSTTKLRKLKNNQAGQAASNQMAGLQLEFGQAWAGFKQIMEEKNTTDQPQEQDKSLSLQHKPPVYASSLQDEVPPIPNMSGGGGFPTLDLTSGIGMMAAGEPTGSGSELLALGCKKDCSDCCSMRVF